VKNRQAPHQIRIIGDLVLTQKAAPVTTIDGRFVKLVEDMFVTMYAAPGVGLAAPQIGVQQRFFVYDIDDEPQVIINPVIVESDGEAVFTEGCLSIPGLHFEIVRPEFIHVRGVDIDGNDIELELDDYSARVFQHEIDHLEGILLESHLTEEQLKEAKAALRLLRERGMKQPLENEVSRGLRLP